MNIVTTTVANIGNTMAVKTKGLDLGVPMYFPRGD